MFHSCSLVLLTLVAGQADDAQGKPAPQGPDTLRGKVVDVFDGNQLLLSFGRDQGARKGLVGCLHPHPSPPELLIYGGYGEIEFVEVGARHSVVRIRYSLYALFGTNFPNLYLPAPKQPQIPVKEKTRLKEGDAVVWYSRYPRPAQEYRPAYPLSGGAIIDLSRPSGSKLFPK
jgi:hypothetical protein